VRGATLAVMDVRKSRLALLASRNAIPNDFREIITLVESGRINLMPWITHRFDLADTPQRFPEIAANPDVIKTLIST
jgi:threonine dehydrogenase-like Zn-dependent dehydrogenase